MRKHTTALLAALAMTLLPMAVAPAAHADVCGDVGGPYANVNGCLPAPGEGAAIVGSVVAADAWDEARQRWEGRPPCFTPAGVPYYTPGDLPC